MTEKSTPVAKSALQVQYDMNIWTYLLDAVFDNVDRTGDWDINRCDIPGQSTYDSRTRKPDGIIFLAGKEFLLIESAHPDALEQQKADMIKLAQMLKAATVQRVVNFRDHPLPLSVFGVMTAGSLFDLLSPIVPCCQFRLGTRLQIYELRWCFSEFWLFIRHADLALFEIPGTSMLVYKSLRQAHNKQKTLSLNQTNNFS